jgi:hypothetical protein
MLYDGLALPTYNENGRSDLPSSAYTWDQDARQAIACGDALPSNNFTMPGFQEHLARLKRDSPDFGALWSILQLTCSSWKIRPKYRFSGPWTSPEAGLGLVEGRPAASLLFLSSRYDPITPLANAYKMAAAHPGARVLVQDNYGHGSLFTPSRCRQENIRRYFATGELPFEGTVCQSDCKPFEDCQRVNAALPAGGAPQKSLDASSRIAPLETVVASVKSWTYPSLSFSPPPLIWNSLAIGTVLACILALKMKKN